MFLIVFLFSTAFAFDRYPLPELVEFHSELDRLGMLDIELIGKLYSLQPFSDFKVYEANAWNKLIGYHCPSGQTVYPLEHSFLKDLYTCIPKPKVLNSQYLVYRIKPSSHDNVTVQCKNRYYNVSVAFCQIESYRFLIDNKGDTWFTSDYCLSNRYMTDNDGKELFTVSHTSTDYSVTFEFPPPECPFYPYDVYYEKSLPATVCIDSSPEFKSCVTGAKCEVHPPYELLPVSTHSELHFKVNGTCSVAFMTFTEPTTITYHIKSALSTSFIDAVLHALLSLLRPLIDALLELVTYIIDTLVTIFTSSEFVAIYQKIYHLILSVLQNVFDYIIDVAVPKIMDLFYESTLKTKFIILTFIYVYFKYTKFIYALSVCVVVCLFFSK
ncbi:hypothetical protein 2 [Biratnagar virus]|uniref:hypothetical protein 2 n=1 Tax=Biratnagar virus TaxID=1955197 RepID=UPI000995A210|nr:hypothetical protein 2 [Biratnagar virus]AQM55288.1 hypothetical protein 2 [Biratnagar virus]